MFKNFISRLRSSFQPINDNEKTNTLNNIPLNIPKTSTDQNKQIKVVNVEEEFKLNDTILSSESEEKEVQEMISDDEVKTDFSQLMDSMDNKSLRKSNKIISNKDLNVQMVDSAVKNNFVSTATDKIKGNTVDLKDSKNNADMTTFENSTEQNGVTNINFNANIKNTESTAETNVEGDDYINNIETTDIATDTFKSPCNSDINSINEHTNKCLEEFNKILGAVQRKGDFLAQNDEPLLEDFDENVLDENFNLDIDPFADIQMCEVDNTFDANNNETEMQSFINISSLLKQSVDDSLNNSRNYKIELLTPEDCLKEIEVVTNNIQTVKRTCSGKTERPNNPKLTECNNDIISISSEDEMEGKNTTENVQEKLTENLKFKMNPQVPDTVQTTVDNILKSLANNKAKKLYKLKLSNLNSIKNASNKTCAGVKKLNHTVRKNMDEEDLKNILTDIVRKNQSAQSISMSITSVISNKNPNNAGKQTLEIDNKNTIDKSKENDNLDTISLSSDENTEKTRTKTDVSDDCGYHSSDFEFITEEEAKKEGLFRKSDREKDFKRPVTRYARHKRPYRRRNKVQIDPYAPGPSHQYCDQNIEEENQDEQENYSVPDENQLINMFQALPPMPLSEIHYLENKSTSIQSRVPMLVQYEGLGFDMNLALQQDHNTKQEHRKEAVECRKKILEMYSENSVLRRSKRRRN